MSEFHKLSRGFDCKKFWWGSNTEQMPCALSISRASAVCTASPVAWAVLGFEGQSQNVSGARKEILPRFWKVIFRMKLEHESKGFWGWFNKRLISERNHLKKCFFSSMDHIPWFESNCSTDVTYGGCDWFTAAAWCYLIGPRRRALFSV